MNNIKGLYFKLNMDNPRDEHIYRFFSLHPDFEKHSKIEVLDKMVNLYIKTRLSTDFDKML